MVRFLNAIQKPDEKMSGFRMPFENRMKMSDFLKVDHSKSDLNNVRFSNDSSFWMVGFRIPTVMDNWMLRAVNFLSKNLDFGGSKSEFGSRLSEVEFLVKKI